MSESYSAHIFGRRKVGEREEVRITMFDEDGTPISMDSSSPPASVVKPLKLRQIFSTGGGQDGGPIIFVFGDFPNLVFNQFEAFYITATNENIGLDVMAVSREVLVLRSDNSILTAAKSGNGKFRVKTNSGSPDFIQTELAELNYWYTFTAQPASYYSSSFHPAGTTIVVTKAMHGIQDMGNTNGRGLIVQVQDNATGMVETPQSVQISSAATVTITFAGTVALNSKRVTIMGGGPSTGW